MHSLSGAHDRYHNDRSSILHARRDWGLKPWGHDSNKKLLQGGGWLTINPLLRVTEISEHLVFILCDHIFVPRNEPKDEEPEVDLFLRM